MGYIPGASFTNMDELQYQHGYVFMYIIDCGMKLLIHSQNTVEVWEWISNFIPDCQTCDYLSMPGLTFQRTPLSLYVIETCHLDWQLYNSVIFEGATLVYRPDCNAEGGCHANSARAKRGRYWLWQPPEALQEGRYTSVAPEQNHAISIITTWSHNVLSFYKLFACGSVPCGALI